MIRASKELQKLDDRSCAEGQKNRKNDRTRNQKKTRTPKKRPREPARGWGSLENRTFPWTEIEEEHG